MRGPSCFECGNADRFKSVYPIYLSKDRLFKQGGDERNVGNAVGSTSKTKVQQEKVGGAVAVNRKM